MSNTSTNQWLSWIRLIRASALPSAVSNILVGFLLATHNWEPVGQLLLLILCSCCLYSSGMILNDICDLEADQELNPRRPLPSKTISKSAAWMAYFILTAVGIFLAFIVGKISLYLALAIVLAIIMYDWVFKKTLVGPVFMGCCRCLNILLGGSLSLASPFDSDRVVLLMIYAISIGVVVTGLTYLGRNERQIISQKHVAKSALLMTVGGAFLIAASFWSPNTIVAKAACVLVLLAVLFRPFRQLYDIAMVAHPDLVRSTVVTTLKSFILIDATFCLLADPGNFYFAVAVAALIVPAKILGRWISST